MISDEAAEAVSLARARIGIEESVRADVVRVQRLDKVGKHYYLVVFGPQGSRTGVATVDASSKEVAEWAVLPGGSEHLAINAETATSLARMPGATTDLVWQSCRASRSPLYPLWRLRDAHNARYVNQQGEVWSDLDDGGRGG
ncbi:MAG: hypothetical protein WBV06_11430 [Acidimicrobiia bacterium]